EKMLPVFERYGLALDNLVVQNVSLPEELQKVLDQRIGMNMVGDLGKYTQYQTANAIPVAAANEGGVAGASVGLGAGIAMGQAMAAGMTQAAQPAAPTAQTPEDIPALLEKLHGLVSKGILSQEEFEAKKAELLKKLV
ncbi:MAG: SHOCT domain-containing protein, partial [Sulfurimicrobium sp.]|nr:SHOCT domain-containing protein [Sulfurimicrobium sp.]